MPLRPTDDDWQMISRIWRSAEQMAEQTPREPQPLCRLSAGGVDHGGGVRALAHGRPGHHRYRYRGQPSSHQHHLDPLPHLDPAGDADLLLRRWICQRRLLAGLQPARVDLWRMAAGPVAPAGAPGVALADRLDRRRLRLAAKRLRSRICSRSHRRRPWSRFGFWPPTSRWWPSLP